MTKRTAPGIGVASDDLNICCDVGMDEIHLLCPPASESGFMRVVPMANRTDAIRATLAQIRDSVGPLQASRLRVVVEPTGVYHKLLMRIARSMGFGLLWSTLSTW